MKIKTVVDDVETFGQRRNVAKKFTQKTSPKQIDILVNRIYSRKVDAVIRELCCNAYDAHKMLGKETTPFDISLPSAIDPRFIVRDYGPGVSEQDVEDVLTTFFESTKDASDDFIGGFGLGFKVPFALVDTFSINSYQNGGMMTYTMYRENGELMWRPETMEPLPTDEPDGLEVIVPISQELHAEFAQVAPDILYWFETPPQFSAAEETFKRYDDACKLDLTDEYGRIRIFSNINRGYGYNRYTMLGGHGYNTVILTMGQVAYRLEGMQTNLPTTTVLDIPIGSVEIQPGRETLSYDAATKEYLQARLDSAVKTITEHYQKDIEGSTSLRDAYIRASKDENRPDFVTLQYKDQPIQPYHVQTYYFPVQGCEPIVEQVPNKFDWQDHPTLFGVAVQRNLVNSIIQGSTQVMAWFKQHAESTATPESLLNFVKPIYVFLDEEIGLKKKLTKVRNKVREKYANSKQLTVLVYVTGQQNYYESEDTTFHGRELLEKTAADEYVKLLHPDDEYYRVSKMTSTRERNAHVWQIPTGARSLGRKSWRVTPLPSKPAIYWPIENQSLQGFTNRQDSYAQWSNGHADTTAIYRMITGHFTAKEKKEVYLVPVGQIKDLPKGWVSVFKLIADQLGEWRKDRTFLKSIAWARHGRLEYSAKATMVGFLKKELTKGHELFDVITEHEAQKDPHEAEARTAIAMMWLLGDKRVDYKAQEHANRATRLRNSRRSGKVTVLGRNIRIEKITEKYPLVFGNHYYGNDKKIFAELALYANAKYEMAKA